jgi:hypothetical protein
MEPTNEVYVAAVVEGTTDREKLADGANERGVCSDGGGRNHRSRKDGGWSQWTRCMIDRTVDRYGGWNHRIDKMVDGTIS